MDYLRLVEKVEVEEFSVIIHYHSLHSGKKKKIAIYALVKEKNFVLHFFIDLPSLI